MHYKQQNDISKRRYSSNQPNRQASKHESLQKHCVSWVSWLCRASGTDDRQEPGENKEAGILKKIFRKARFATLPIHSVWVKT